MKETIINEMTARVVSTKKINVRDPEGIEKNQVSYIKNVITGIFDYIELFNSIPEFTTTMSDGRRFEDIVVAKEWCQFIYPESVRYDPTDLKTNNLIIKLTGVDSVFNYNEWLNKQLTFRSWFRMDLSQATENLANLRAPRSLSDVLPIARFVENHYDFAKIGEKNDLRSIDEPYIPIPIDIRIKCMFRDDYLNMTSEQMVKDWMAKFSM